MVTVLRMIVYNTWIHDVRCLSTDEKPVVGIKNGSTCLEMDTGKLYMFDEANRVWYEQ
jgi:hypothetical protein